MKTSNYIPFLLFVFIPFFVYSQLVTVQNKTTYPFWIHTPTTQENQKQPLLLFLHGKSLSGTDLNKVKRYGVLRAMEKGREIPAIVVAPQLASGSWNPDKVLELIEYLKLQYPIDTQRI